MCPVGAYYPEGIDPVKIYVENNYVRAVKGGLGFTKTPGNYAASIKAQEEAEQKGFTQVLWLDGVEKKYIEEVGTMNVFFKVNGEVFTPSLEGSILAGITRDSTIKLLKHWGVPVSERRISIDEIVTANNNGKLEEAFGTGTAAVISPIGELYYEGQTMTINDNKTGEVAKRIYDTITGIQSGNLEDPFGWTIKVE
jgi:branched-chain amino acid aminotransferase